jgi:hypothetical protein
MGRATYSKDITLRRIETPSKFITPTLSLEIRIGVGMFSRQGYHIE